ncbi:MAG: Uncharacterized protein K0Q49_786 [Haloplasmataceae bacterium]|nr:Uncharacterized protein [Haloplasmataceae bacterium]
MNKYIIKALSSLVKFFSIEEDNFDLLNTTEVLLKRNVLVNRLLAITNVLITIFMFILNINSNDITFIDTLVLLIPSIGLNVLITYLVNTKQCDEEKQLLGMYVGVLSVSWIAFRLFATYPAPYTYVFIYFALVVIALFQNRNAMLMGDVFIFVIASYIHFSEMFKDFSPIFTSKGMSLNEITVYTLFLVLFILVLTAMVFFSEYMDKQRKDELAKREKIENEFNDVLFSVFDTIEDFSQVTEDDELSSDYVTALMAKKLGLLLKYEEEKCDQLFSFAIVIGVNNDFSLDYDENQKASLLKDYSKIKYKLNIGQSLLKRTRIKIKCEGMVRSRYESWFVSENFKKIKSEDDSIDNQIVLLCEMYVILRDKQSYKKALPHIKAIKEITDTFNHFFDESLLNTFLENHVEFEVIYERTRSV